MQFLTLRSTLSWVSLACWVCFASLGNAQIGLNDSFDVGSPATRGNDAVDPLDAAWWSANSPTFSVVDDTGGINHNNALQVNTSNGGNGQQAVGNQFGMVSLGTNIGDRLSLSFAFRFTKIVTGNGTALRFGLYSDNGTTVTGDGQKPLTDNDRGYFGEFGFGTISAAAVMAESGGGGALLEGNDVVDKTTGSTPFAINDLLAHSALFTLTRDINGVILDLTIDGASRATGGDSTLILTTFNELAFENRDKELDFLVDNVKLELVPVPEPSTMALFALGAAACLWNRLIARARKTGTRRTGKTCADALSA